MTGRRRDLQMGVRIPAREIAYIRAAIAKRNTELQREPGVSVSFNALLRVLVMNWARGVMGVSVDDFEARERERTPMTGVTP